MPLQRDPAPPLAIIGMGMRLPGGISTAEEFWSLLIGKKDGRCRVPSSRYNVDAFYGDKTHQQNIATDNGYFLDVDIKGFDTTFFGVKRTELDVTDPQLRLLLEVVWECFESAGQSNFRGTNTGVFVGTFGEDWHNMLHKDSLMRSTYRVLSAGDYALSNMLSWEYDLSGPSMTLRTACSSSLSALHLACQAIYNGDCPMAIVAGSSIILDPAMTLDMSEAGVLSPTGSCKTFDAAADGFARGEAINAVLIKPLDDAMRDGDPVRAVIRSTAVNSDGRTSHIGSPSSDSQVTMIRRAYERAGIEDPSQTPFIECHGTGTVRGDPIEAAAVASVFGEHGAYIGSVKPNLGHGEGAAALTSIIKAILALENETIPPNINFITPNPKIPFQDYKLEVPIEPVPWPKNRPARISVSSFGIGGANGHVILDSAASFAVHRRAAVASGKSSGESHAPLQISDSSSDESSEKESLSDSTSIESSDGLLNNATGRRCDETLGKQDVGHTGEALSDSPANDVSELPFLFPISAGSEQSLSARVDDLKRYLEARPESIGDVAFTLGTRREHLRHRTFCIARPGTSVPLDFGSFGKVSGTARKDSAIAFVFTGQGAQWPGMGKSLIESLSGLLEDMQDMDRVLQQLKPAPEWTLEALLRGTDNARKDALNDAELAQPLCTALQIGLVNFLRLCGVTPGAVIGHSSGEIAAAYTAGAITMNEAITCAYLRGLAAKSQSRVGGMAAVGKGRKAVLPFLVDGVHIACENSPESVTISGDLDALERSLKAITDEDPEAFTRKLDVNVAYHSHHMQEIGGIYEGSLEAHLSPKHPLCPFYSTVTGGLVTNEFHFGAEYWRSNLESPVLFHTAMDQLLDDLPNVTATLEIGPHSALRGPLRQILQVHKTTQPVDYIATLQRSKDSAMSILNSVGQLFVRGYNVDFVAICPDACVLTDLPSYPWDHQQEFWRESQMSQAWRQRKYAHHELLGIRCAEATEHEPMWRNLLHQYDVPWLADHKVGPDVVFPVAGFIAMMGEAIRQFTDSDGYVLRHLMVKSALLMPQTDPVELMTTLKPLRLTGLTNSSRWYELSVSAFNGITWVESCIARGRPAEGGGGEDLGDRTTATTLPYLRKVPERYFYDRVQSQGLRYGPRFQLLKDISADVESHAAVATVRDDESEYEAPYAVHPTTIDCCLQLGVLANCQGIARKLTGLVLPVAIEDIFVHPGGPDLALEAAVDPSANTAEARAVATESNRTVLEIKNGRFMPFNAGDSEADVIHASRVQWLPDIDCHDQRGLIRRNDSKRDILIASERLAAACILQLFKVLRSLDVSPSGHLAKYAAWVERERDLIARGRRDSLVPESQRWTSMDEDSLQGVLDTLLEDVHAFGDPAASDVAVMVRRLALRERIEPLFKETSNPLELFLEDSGMKSFYDFAQQNVDIDPFIYLCAHANPTLKVLEIGAGTGSASEAVLRSLTSEGGTRMYSQYVFTDLSSGFFGLAQDRLRQLGAVDYKVLDVEKDPEEQGFELGSFDLIVASNVLHATRSLQCSLKHVRSLLRPGGRLYLEELIAPMNIRLVNLLTGTLPGWWIGQDDGREDVPFVSVARWDEELRNAGFSGVDSVMMDDDAPHYICGHIISHALVPVIERHTVLFLYDNRKHEFACSLATEFEREGICVQWSRIGDHEEHAEGLDAISTIDLEGPYFDDISQEDFSTFMNYLSRLKGGLLWLTRSAQLGCKDPRYGIVTGLARTIRPEIGVDFWTAELDSLDSATTASVAAIYRKFHARPGLDAESKLDSEYAVKDGVVHIGRYHWSSTVKELQSQSSPDPKQLIIGRFGLIGSMHWVQHQPSDVGDDEVEIEVRCVGLNFKDIMVAMGFVPESQDTLGIEATGVITRVGAAVGSLKVGARVCVLANGLLATRKVVPARLVLPIPHSLSFEEAVTLPVAYVTVLHAIMNLGQLARGQSILIHSAAGGVGQAAMHVSHMLGAEIYVTVGTEEKIQYLIDNHSIPRERIFNSRDTSFLDGIMQITNGRGVDMVLNSLSGDLLHASWQCVAKNGKMMEIGKRDILEHGHLDLDLFGGNRSFHGIDLRALWSEMPENLLRLLDQLSRLGMEQQLKPIRPIHTFPVEEISDAFRFMKKGQHIGKIVIQMPRDTESIPARVPHEPELLSSTSTYLLIGGLGGLGKEVTRWMVEKGARSFCFLSRSADDSGKHGGFFQELESQGCRITTVSGSVAEMSDTKRAIAAAPTPIVGVVQMSMVLRDHSLLQMSYDDWKAVQDPKVKGTWNLHEALAGVALDFFILFGSIVGVAGQPGQGNYASANSFLDSFMQYRHGLGLPCSVIDLGGMEGIGFLTTRPDKMNQYRNSGLYFLREEQLMEAVRIAISRSSPRDGLGPVGPRGALSAMSQLAVGMRSKRSLSDPRNTILFTRDIRFGLYINMNPVDQLDTVSRDEEMREFLKDVEENPEVLNKPDTLHRISMEIGRTLFKFLALPEEDLDIGMTLESIGVDSLVSIEIRNWWRRSIGLEVTVLEILNAGTIEGLGRLAISSLGEKYKLERGGSGTSPGEAATAAADTNS